MHYALAVTFALFLWWFSTGAVLYVVGLPKRMHGWSMLVLSAIALLSLFGIATSSSDESALGAYCAFTCALAVWAWHEMSFLMGFVTGPRSEPCPPDAKGWQRFVYASLTLIYHEAAILVTLGIVAVITAGAPNHFALWTLLVLWGMRLSAKFNVFLGVPNLTEEFLPDGLAFLKSYFRKQPMNLLFPISVTISTVVAWVLTHDAINATSGFEAAGFTMLAVLMALAVLEHWFLVLPLPVADLWRWGLASRDLEKDRKPTGEKNRTILDAHPIQPNAVANEDASLINFIAGR